MNEITTAYDTNHTMKLLGKQDISIMFNDEIIGSMNDVMEARPYSCTKDTAHDLFLLGYIHGIRAERAKKRGIK